MSEKFLRKQNQDPQIIELQEKEKWLSEEKEQCFIDGQKYNELREQKDKEIEELQKQLKSQPKEIVEKIKKEFDARKLEYVSCLTKLQCYGLRIDRISEILDTILKEYEDKQ